MQKGRVMDLEVSEGSFGYRAGIRGCPQEDGIDGTDTQLHGRNCHRKTSGPTSSIKRNLAMERGVGASQTTNST